MELHVERDLDEVMIMYIRSCISLEERVIGMEMVK